MQVVETALDRADTDAVKCPRCGATAHFKMKVENQRIFECVNGHLVWPDWRHPGSQAGAPNQV